MKHLVRLRTIVRPAAGTPKRSLALWLGLTLLGTANLAWAGARADDTWLTLAGPREPTRDRDGALGDSRVPRPTHVAVDWAGNVYVAEVYWHTVRKITPQGHVSTLAGRAGKGDHDDGRGAEARFYGPHGLAVDRDGNVIVADYSNHTLRQISPAGDVITLAGVHGRPGFVDGPGNLARLNGPTAVAVDGLGNVWFSDGWNHVVRKVTPAGHVGTVAGRAGHAGFADGPSTQAQFNRPVGLVVDRDGNLFVADQYNQVVRKITPAGVVTTLAGLAGTAGCKDGLGPAARFQEPFSLAISVEGSLYLAAVHNHNIRKITPEGWVTTVAGGPNGEGGNLDGPALDARFNGPHGVAVDRQGALYVADHWNNAVRRVSRDGQVTTLAGAPAMFGYADGPGGDARFFYALRCRVDATGNLYVTDHSNHVLRKITPDGTVSTFAGRAGHAGVQDGTGAEARFHYPGGLTIHPSGDLYVTDVWSHVLRRVSPAGEVTTVAGRAGQAGATDGTGGDARFYAPHGLAFDRHGRLWIADSYNHLIRMMDPAGNVLTIAGRAGEPGTTDGPAAAARFRSPRALIADAAANIYVADTENHTLRRIDPDGNVTTLAGLAGTAGGTDGTGPAARFNQPQDLALDSAGDLVVADIYNHVLRKVTPAGVVTTLAGRFGGWGTADGQGDQVQFHSPISVALDAQDHGFVTEWDSFTVRRSFRTCPDQPAIDQSMGLVGTPRQLDTAPRTAVSWQWEMLRRPAGSQAQLSATHVRNPTFIPDVADGYTFRLQATDATGAVSIRNVEFQALTGPRGGTFAWSPATVAIAPDATTVTLTVTREGALQHAASVDFATVNASATAGTDFVATSDRLSFAPGESWKPVVIGLDPDRVRIAPKTFLVSLRDATPGWALDAPDAVVALNDPEPPHPALLLGPQAQTAALGTVATFSVIATGAGPLRYQWMKGSEALRDQTNSVLVLPGVRRQDAGLYSVIVTNDLGPAVSATASLTIVDALRLRLRSPASPELPWFIDVLGVSAPITLILEEATDLPHWHAIITNVVPGAPAGFEVPPSPAKAFYRVRIP